MYYILPPYVSLVGYLKLPYGLFDMRSGRIRFCNKKQYDFVALCDGQHVIAPEKLDPEDRQTLDSLLQLRLIEAREEPGSLAAHQKYIYYDNRYKEYVQWSVTGRCNYRCRHCFMSAPDAKFGHPTLEQCRTVIEGMAAAGIRVVCLTGGEPLVRKDLFEIIDMLHQYGIGMSTLYTNGALLNRSFMDKLAERRMKPTFQLSFDGLGCHDWMRGIDGAEKAVIAAFDLIREYGCPFGVSMVLHRHNVGSIRETVRFLADKGCSYIKINIAEPCGNWASQTEHFLKLPELFQAFLDYIPQFAEDGKPMSMMLGGTLDYDKDEEMFTIPYDKGRCRIFDKSPVCSCIRSGVYISPEGVLLPCMSMVGGKIAAKFPSVYDTPLPELLRSSSYTEMMSMNMSDYVEHNRGCAECPYLKLCRGGCRAIAVGDEGTDFFARDEEACAFFRDGWYDRFRKVLSGFSDSVYADSAL